MYEGLISLFKTTVLEYAKPLSECRVYTRLRGLLHFSLLNCTRISRRGRPPYREACVSGRTKKKEGRKRHRAVLYRRPAYAGNGKKGRRNPHRVCTFAFVCACMRAKMPKHNITVLFTAVSVNMRDYERRAARNVQP